jgi:hypothetical protein
MQLMRRTLLILGGLAGILLLLVACNGTDENKSVATNAHEQGTKKQTTVVEPTVSKGKWRAVIIGVVDKQTGKESEYELPIGSQTALPSSGISILVENFLPHFIMQGTVLTSQSNEPKNPAVQIKVFDGGKEIFKGWLFALYPTTHAFQHPRYGFSLKGCVPAK